MNSSATPVTTAPAFVRILGLVSLAISKFIMLLSLALLFLVVVFFGLYHCQHSLREMPRCS